MFAWLDLEPTDIAAYVVSDILGCMVFFWLMPNIFLAVIVSIFVSYHLFLAWLVLSSDNETGLSFRIVTSIFTHLACIVIVYLCSAFVIALSVAGHFIPFYLYLMLRPIRYVVALCVPALAIFERFWLLSGGRKKEIPAAVQAAAASQAATLLSSTADDHAEWLNYVARQKPPFPKPGSSLKGEYEKWMLARANGRVAVPSNNG